MNAAADQVMDLIFGRWRSQTLAAGTELGVFDHLDKRIAKSAETLATELNADPTLLYRLLRAQAAIGLLQEDSSRKFVLTGQGDLLRSGHPQSLKPMARLEEGPFDIVLLTVWSAFDTLSTAAAVRGIEPAVGEQPGRGRPGHQADERRPDANGDEPIARAAPIEGHRTIIGVTRTPR